MCYGCTLMVYKKDKRYKSGERFVKSYKYPGFNTDSMINEINDLKRLLYKPEDGWILSFVISEPIKG